MERLTKLMLTILLMSSIALIGCLEDDSPTGTTDDDKLVGTWEMTAMTINGEAEDIGEGFLLIFRADGTGTSSFEGRGSGPFEWSTNGDSLTIVADGDTETLTFSVTSTTLIIEVEDEGDLYVQTFTKHEDTNNGDHDPDVFGMWNMIGKTIDREDASYDEIIFVYEADGTGEYSSGNNNGTFQWSTDGNKLTITEDGTTVYTYSVTSTTMIREIDVDGE
ncbi:MAG: lipocalin family protein, partial [Calditrichaeota bacterium]|nr:lipocalin family protein [Calditrichota bacterium]